MKTYIRLLLAALVAISVQKVSAQSAVAVGTNGVYGYAYGSGSQRAASRVAELRNQRRSEYSRSHRVLAPSPIGESPIEHITLNFGRVSVDYTPQNYKGASGTAIPMSWDIAANTKP